MAKEPRSRGTGRFREAEELLATMRDDLSPFVGEVEEGPFVRAVLDGSFPLEALQFFVEQTYHLIINDMGNLSLYVARARNAEERDFFLIMTTAERLMLDAAYHLVDAIGIPRERLHSSEPNVHTAARTNYFTRLALYHTAGEIALAILLNFPVWAGGARKVSEGMKQHYSLGRPVVGTDILDTDILDRFSQSTQGFIDNATHLVALDLAGPAELVRMHQVGRLSVEFEAMVWEAYYSEGLRQAER